MKSTALAAALTLACLLPASGRAVEVAGITIADSQQTSRPFQNSGMIIDWSVLWMPP